MKKIPNKLNRGMSTLEILLAFAILILSITAVIGMGFGNQSITVDAETNTEALYKAQSILEDARASTTKDYNSVVSNTFPNDSIYSKSLLIEDLTSCKKLASSTISWETGGRIQTISLGTFFTDVSGALALGGDCIIDPPLGGWTNPYSDCSKDPNYCASIGGSAATDVDVSNINGKKIAFLTSSTGTSGKPDFWIFDVTNAPTSDPEPPLFSLDTGDGLNSIDVAMGSDGHYYAYVAGYSEDSKGSPCGGGIGHKPYSSQFQIIDIDINDFTKSSVIASTTPSAVDACGEFPAGYSIYYYNNKVYLGTKETKGNEFMIFDVSDLKNIKESSISIKRNVNAIVVRNGFAYLATGPGAAETNPFKIYDVNPISVNYKKEVGSFITSKKTGEGTSLFLIGNKAYLGSRRHSTSDELFVLDVKNPELVTLIKSVDFDQSLCIDDPAKPNSKKPCIGSANRISGIVVVSPFAFLAIDYSTGGFQVWNISDMNNIKNISMYNYSEKATGIDYLDNKIYVSNESNNGLRIIVDKP